jgi:hypothetical protein
MSYYERNKEKCKKNALERLHRLKETRNDDIKSYQALYFQLNKERIYKKKPKVEKMHIEPIAETINIKKLIAKLPKEKKVKKPKTPKAPKIKVKPITTITKGEFILSFD